MKMFKNDLFHTPCREDLANAAISWMVRALLDLGNISTVSSTFTCNDTKAKQCEPAGQLTVREVMT